MSTDRGQLLAQAEEYEKRFSTNRDLQYRKKTAAPSRTSVEYRVCGMLHRLLRMKSLYGCNSNELWATRRDLEFASVFEGILILRAINDAGQRKR